MNKFEDFLIKKHAEQYIGTKDAMINDFEDWLTKLDIDDWINYGDWFGKYLENKLRKESNNDENMR